MKFIYDEFNGFVSRCLLRKCYVFVIKCNENKIYESNVDFCVKPALSKTRNVLTTIFSGTVSETDKKFVDEYRKKLCE